MGVEASSVAARAAAALRAARPRRESLNSTSRCCCQMLLHFANHGTKGWVAAEAFFITRLKKKPPPGLLSSHVPEQIKTLTSFWGHHGSLGMQPSIPHGTWRREYIVTKAWGMRIFRVSSVLT